MKKLFRFLDFLFVILCEITLIDRINIGVVEITQIKYEVFYISEGYGLQLISYSTKILLTLKIETLRPIQTAGQGIKSAVDFSPRVKFILSLEGGFAYAYNWRIFKHMQGIYKDA